MTVVSTSGLSREDDPPDIDSTLQQSYPEQLDVQQALVIAESSTISVAIHPPIALTFHCASTTTTAAAVPCNHDPTEAELISIATAAQEFIHENDMIVDLALTFEAYAIGIEYDGIELTASSFVRRRLLEEGIMKRRGNGHLRNGGRRLKDGNQPILLSGMVHFTAPPDISPSDIDSAIPSETHLSDMLLALLVKEQSAFIDKLHSMEDSNDDAWLKRLIGYRTQFEEDLVDDTPAGDTTGAIDSQGGITMMIAQFSNDNDTGSSSSSGSSYNTLLIVGAAEAGFSLILLVAGLCYAKKSYKDDTSSTTDDSKRKNSQTANSNDVLFQPGKNNPRSLSTSANTATSKMSFFKKSSKDALEGSPLQTLSSSAPPSLPMTTGDILNAMDDDDDESNADFLLARAALNHSANNKVTENGSIITGDDQSQANTFGDDMSYAFTVDGESLAPLGVSGTENNNNGKENKEDAMIGAGGMASFANEKGVFRWNDEGTKMVYTPNLPTNCADGGADNANNKEENNGFVFNERKKKWVVKEQVVGEKNVSFQQTNRMPGPNTPQQGILRTRSNDSVGTGFTGLSEFTYDDVALDNAKRSRSGGTSVASLSVMGSIHSGGSGANTIGGSGGSGNNRKYGVMNIPPSPGTPQEQGVEVTADQMLQPNTPNSRGGEDEFFVSNTNVERFMMGNADDESTAFSGFADFANNSAAVAATPPITNNLSNKKSWQPAGLPPPLNRITPERVHSQNSDAATMSTFSTSGTGDSGRIVPKSGWE